MRRLLQDAFAIAAKDLLLEVRTRDRVATMFTFAILVALVFSFTLDASVQPSRLAGAMIWVTLIFAGLLSLGRSFSMERDQDAITGLLLAPADPSAIYLGKLAANVILLLATAAVVFGVYWLFFNLPFVAHLGGLVTVTILGIIGFMALGTLFSAVAGNTRLGDTLLPILLLPLIVPLIFFAATATQRLVTGRPLSDVMGNIRLLAAFDIIFLIACVLLFRSVVEE